MERHINDLPEEMIDQILSSMPTRDSAKMSILSPQWRDRWWRWISRNSPTSLSLVRGRFSPPSTVRGFKNLTTLNLYYVIITREALQSLISCSPALVDLKLTFIECVDDGLVIDAPCLKRFSFNCRQFAGLGPINCPALEKCIFQANIGAEKNNLNKRIADLPHVPDLTVLGWFLPHVVSGAVFANVRLLTIDVSFGSAQFSTSFYMLLKCLPNLEKLDISRLLGCIEVEKNNQEWKASQWDLTFPRLRWIRVRYYEDSWRRESSFLELVLLASPILEKMFIVLKQMTLTPGFKRAKLKFANMLMGLKGASPGAKISVS